MLGSPSSFRRGQSCFHLCSVLSSHGAQRFHSPESSEQWVSSLPVTGISILLHHSFCSQFVEFAPNSFTFFFHPSWDVGRCGIAPSYEDSWYLLWGQGCNSLSRRLFYSTLPLTSGLTCFYSLFLSVPWALEGGLPGVQGECSSVTVST